MFPTLGVVVGGYLSDDMELRYDLLHGFNRWLDDDWGFDRDGRIHAVPHIVMADVDRSVFEIDAVAVQGNRNRVIIQNPGPGESAAATTGRGTVRAGNTAEPESFWRRWMWWIVGVATIVAAVAAALALLL